MAVMLNLKSRVRNTGYGSGKHEESGHHIQTGLSGCFNMANSVNSYSSLLISYKSIF